LKLWCRLGAILALKFPQIVTWKSEERQDSDIAVIGEYEH